MTEPKSHYHQSHSTRRRSDLHCPFNGTSAGKFSFTFQGFAPWSSVKSRTATISTSSFRRKLMHVCVYKISPALFLLCLLSFYNHPFSPLCPLQTNKRAWCLWARCSQTHNSPHNCIWARCHSNSQTAFPGWSYPGEASQTILDRSCSHMALMSSFKADVTAECFRHLGGVTCAVCRTVMFFVFFIHCIQCI